MMEIELGRAKCTRDAIYWALDAGMPDGARENVCRQHEYWKRRVTELEAAEEEKGTTDQTSAIHIVAQGVEGRVNAKIERLEELIRYAREGLAQLSSRVTTVENRVGALAIRVAELEVSQKQHIAANANIERLDRSIEYIRRRERLAEEKFDAVADGIRASEKRRMALAIRVAELEGERQRRETRKAEQRARSAITGPSPYDLGAAPSVHVRPPSRTGGAS